MYVLMGRLSINDGNFHGIPMRSQEPNEAGKNHRTNLRHPLVARILPPSMTNSMTIHVSMNEQCVTRMNILLIQHICMLRKIYLLHTISCIPTHIPTQWFEGFAVHMSMILCLVDGVSRNAFEICEWSDDSYPSCFFGHPFQPRRTTSMRQWLKRRRSQFEAKF